MGEGTGSHIPRGYGGVLRYRSCNHHARHEVVNQKKPVEKRGLMLVLVGLSLGLFGKELHGSRACDESNWCEFNTVLEGLAVRSSKFVFANKFQL